MPASLLSHSTTPAQLLLLVWNQIPCSVSVLVSIPINLFLNHPPLPSLLGQRSLRTSAQSSIIAGSPAGQHTPLWCSFLRSCGGSWLPPSLSVSYGSSNKLSQTWWLTTEVKLSQFWKPLVWNQGVSRATFSSEVPGENPSLPPWLLEEASIPLASASLCLRFHMAFSSVSLSQTCHWVTFIRILVIALGNQR